MASRRHARLRAAALAAIPLALFVLAAAPRAWAPDLVPFGSAQASSVVEAAQRAPVSWPALYADRTVTPLALVYPLLREAPSPVVSWVVLRALADALGVAILYHAARPLAGVAGGVLAALLYAASPVAWAAARDPAGSFGPPLLAMAALAAVRLTAHPTGARGVVLGAVLGVLARSLPLELLVVPLGVVALALGRASWRVGGVTALALVLVAGPVLFRGAVDGVAGLALPPTSDVAGWAALGACLTPPLALLLAIATTARRAVVRRVARISAVALIVLAASITALAIDRDAQVEWSRQAFGPRPSGRDADGALPMSLGGLPGDVPSLREALALADTIRDTAGRAGASEVVLANARISGALAAFPYGPLLEPLRTRSLGSNVVLPLERETVYLIAEGSSGLMEGPGVAVEVARPSSQARVFTPGGADTGARVLTLRPRSAVDWLVRARAVADGRFADGSALLGVSRAAGDGRLDLALYWELPAADDGRTLGAHVQLRAPAQLGAGPAGASFPAVADRRGGELVVQHVRLPLRSGVAAPARMVVTVHDGRGAPIRTIRGAVELEVPLDPAAQ